ncbi:MAG TPA: carbohydrate ABC transporter permease [Geminicoccaceae bacterium]|nr:carbohydrate ABC transporter permease [Geminicoccus sp.]HMU49028.1 carbohydrate ABC transporter permease [Geminicoccaceae bacterium]
MTAASPALASAAAAESAEAARRRASKRRRRRLLQWLEGAVLLAVAIVIMFPILWMVMTAFKHPSFVYSYTIWFPPTLDNFREVFSERWQIMDKIINSTVIAVSTVVIAIPIAVCSAYAFSRLAFPLKRTMFQWILLTQFIPAVTIVLPFYLMFRGLGLLDTYAALIVVDLAIVLPYAIWTIKGFIDAIPMETEEAAIVDGASRLRVIRDIVVPMARPGILTAAVFCFIITWNEFLFGYLLSRQKVVPLPVGIISFVLERGPVWELIAATGIIITIPMFFFALIIQRHFTKGMNLGAVR